MEKLNVVDVWNDNFEKETPQKKEPSREELLDCIRNFMGLFDNPVARRKMSDPLLAEVIKEGRFILERTQK